MRGDDPEADPMFSYVTLEQRVPADHPLRLVRRLTDEALTAPSPRFSAMYARTGRPSISPEKLLRALLLQILYSVRSERQLMEQLDYNLLFRWFVGLPMDAPVWSATTFSKNRQRLLDGDVAQAFFVHVKAQAEGAGLLSAEHFTVDGTLLEAYASLKSFQPKDAPTPPSDDDPGNPTIDFHGQRRSNLTHQSTTDPDSRLFQEGRRPAVALGLQRDGAHGEPPRVGRRHRHGARRQSRRSRGCLGDGPPLGAGPRDGWRRQGFRSVGIRDWSAGARQDAHVAAKVRRSVLDGRTTGPPGYAISQRLRKRVEEIFGWIKTVGLLRKLRHRGLARVGWMFTFTAAAYNLVRMRRLLAA